MGEIGDGSGSGFAEDGGSGSGGKEEEEEGCSVVGRGGDFSCSPLWIFSLSRTTRGSEGGVEWRF